MTPVEEPFCGFTLLEFGKYYAANVSGYADIPICLIGVILNLFNLMVFTRKTMISPASLIFTHLALVDLIVLLSCIPFTWYIYIRDSDDSGTEKWAYEWLIFAIYGSDFMAMMHSISIWLTVMLTIWRYVAIAHSSRESAWCSLRITNYMVIASYAFCTLICTPFYLAHDVKIGTNNGTTTYSAVFKQNSVLYAMVFIVNGFLLKLLPSLVLTFFSFRLIKTLLKMRKHHKLISPSKIQTKVVANTGTKKIVDRSTSILMVVLVLFLIAEVPLGILGVLNAVYGNGIHHECYDFLGRICDTVTLINTSITFVVYYILNQRFRTTFKNLFYRNKPISPEKGILSCEFSGNTNTYQV